MATKTNAVAGLLQGRAMRLLLLVAMLLSALPAQSFANAVPDAGSIAYCGSVLSGSGVLGDVGGASPYNAMVSISLLILLLMINVAALCYLIGYAFKIEKLTRFGKAEIGEVAVTVLVVLIFLGTFQAVTFNPANFNRPSGNFLAAAPAATTNNIFTADCYSLTSSINSVIGNLDVLMSYAQMDNLFSSASFGFQDNHFGFTISPLGGLVLQYAIMSKLINASFILIILPLAVTFMLGIVFALFPIFLYAGIILRCLPWTRPAGGAFLGLFIAFYLMFPLMLYMFVYNSGVSNISGASTAAYANIFSKLFSVNSPLLPGPGLLGFNEITSFIQLVVANLFYILFGVVISFIVSYDFMEAMGDLLGAPSLRASDVMKKLV